MRPTVLAAFAAISFCAAPAIACDDHVGACEVEAWRAYVGLPGMLTIEGSVTCDSGLASIRLYDVSGGEERFLGTATGVVSGHALTAIANNVTEPAELAIRVSIDPM